MLNWSNRLVKYTLTLIIVFLLSSAIGCAKGPAAGLELKPNDLGSDWTYKVKMGPTSFGANGPQFFQDGRELSLSLNRVIIKDDARVIQQLVQVVTVHPYVEEALDRLEPLRDYPGLEPLGLPFWDEAYLVVESMGGTAEAVELTLRKDNAVVFLSYREVLYKEDPVSGKFYFKDYLPLSQEKIQWADGFLLGLAPIVQGKIVAQ